MTARKESPMKFIVSIREVHIQAVEIEADTKEEAVEKVKEGEGEYLEDGLDYSHTLDSEFWTVEELKSEE